MPLAFLGFLQLSLADILDIILLGLIIFFMFRWIKGSSAMSIFVAIVSLYIIRIVVEAFNMRLMTAIMDMILDVGVLALIVIFQPELRKFLTNLGNRYMGSQQGRALVDKITGRKRNHAKYAEEAKISMRNIRQDAMGKIKRAVTDKEISEDDQRKYEEDIQKVFDKRGQEVDAMAKEKEADIMSV